MIKILLQAGHQNTTTGATGAPEERENNIRIRDRLSQILVSKGFQLTLGDANYKSFEHFDLALAMHCDANYPGNEGGGFVDAPDPSVDAVNTESLRIRQCIEDEYFKHSGIRNVPSRENANTNFYYWWYNLSSDTPCVLIEMGESIDPHDRVILKDTDIVANAIARGICKAFNVKFDPIQEPTPSINWEQRYNEEVQAHNRTKKLFDDYKNSIPHTIQIAIDEATKPLLSKMEKAKQDLS